MPDFDYAKLRGKIVEKYGSMSVFAQAMGTSPTQISKLLTHKSSWTQKSIYEACELLGIDTKQIDEYFFAEPIKNT